MKDKKAFIEKFKGFEIFYDKERETFIAEKKPLDLKFRAMRLWEIKGQIKESAHFDKELKQDKIIITGYFDKELSKVKFLTLNKATKHVKYKILECTGSGYDIGKIERSNLKDLQSFGLTKKNLNIYNKISQLEKKRKIIEEEQKSLVQSLEK